MDDEKEEYYKDAFKMFNISGDGQITVEKLGELIKKLNLKTQIPNEDLFEIINNIDKDDKGYFDYEDFKRIMNNKDIDSIKEREIINAFRIFDIDGNRLISKENLTNMIPKLGGDLNENEIKEMINQADIDGDGFINYEEFVRMVLI
jgi:Ca2+-binding EF-hand superfamily protein